MGYLIAGLTDPEDEDAAKRFKESFEPESMLTREETITHFRQVIWTEFTTFLLRIQARSMVEGIDRASVNYMLAMGIPEAADAFMTQLRPSLMVGGMLELLIPDANDLYLDIYQQVKHDQWAKEALYEAVSSNEIANELKGYEDG